MHGRSFVSVIIAGGLALVVVGLVPAAAVEAVVAAEQPAGPIGSAGPANPTPPGPAPAERDAYGPAGSDAANPSPSDAGSLPPASAATRVAPEAHPAVASIRNKLDDPSWGRDATSDDLAALQAFYAGRSGPPVWVTPMGFSARGQAAINEIGKADDWGLSAAAFDLPPAGDLTDTAEEQAVAEIKLQLAILKYARFARGGRAYPSELSALFDQDPPLLDPKIVLTEIATSATPDAYLQSLHPKHEQFHRLRQALLKARGEEEPGKKTSGSEPDIQRLLINMERWRWMPEDLGSVYVQDNVPEFMLYVVKDGKTIHSDKIVVGKLAYATPIFSADMQTLVFNPEWTVPPTIVRENLLPNLRRGGSWFGGGSSVLRQHGLKVRYNGRVVDPGSINWNSVNLAKIAFTQAPGPTNVLGKIKFLYPNKHIVYMHDTIKRGLFKRTVRAEGHNCIRMENPSRLAEILLAEDKGWEPTKIQELVAKGYDSSVNLDRPIPVHTTYFTVIVDEEGKVSSFADIYNLDRKVAPALLRMSPPAEPPEEAEAQSAQRRPSTETGTREASSEEATGSIPGLFDTRR